MIKETITNLAITILEKALRFFGLKQIRNWHKDDSSKAVQDLDLLLIRLGIESEEDFLSYGFFMNLVFYWIEVGEWEIPYDK